ncbi:MAG TPA: alpha-galactosidase, partial [Vicinamibacteria bacterium]
SEGRFRDLYVHGFDAPEGYAIEKGGRMYYAFFSEEPGESWEGTLELRGLRPGPHLVKDYVSGSRLGTVAGPSGTLRARFDGYLLLVASAEG